MTATKLHAYCPSCGSHAVPLSAKGTYRAHNRCPLGRGNTVATAASIARWIGWETESARAGAETCGLRVSRLRDELARAEADHAIFRARLDAITAIAKARGLATKDANQ